MLIFIHYLLFNLGLGFSFFLIKIYTLSSKHYFSQRQQLRFLRLVFCSMVVISLGVPVSFPTQHFVVMTPISFAPSIPQPQHYALSFHQLLVVLITLGVIPIFYYGREIFKINRLLQTAYLVKQIKSVNIYACDHQLPAFCFSLRKHFLILPQTLFSNPRDLQITIKHELQHVRQHDTRWLYVLAVLNLFCYWNPFVYLWIRSLKEQQELSCDEIIITRHKQLLMPYAQCLMNAAHSMESTAIGYPTLVQETSFTFRRITMLFKYRKQSKTLLKTILGAISAVSIMGSAYALENQIKHPLSQSALRMLASEERDYPISVEPEVLRVINHYRTDPSQRRKLQASLQRYRSYHSEISKLLKAQGVPQAYLAMPLVQSGYRELPETMNPMHAAGLWQIIPSTAKHYGLTVQSNRDDRLNTKLSTQAAGTYLRKLHQQFGDWQLATLAYEIGEQKTSELIEKTHSKNIWKLARSGDLPENIRAQVIHYIADFNASILILKHPNLI